MNLNFKQTIIWISIFSVAMGLLETAVVIYLRELYYPNGFTFPLQPIDAGIALTEILREVATLIMLLAIGVMAGRNMITRFAWFLYSFAIWDIFYYIFLKLLINWPESLMTDDVLFLIPATWVGPVITPVIVAFSMIVLALFIVKFDMQGKDAKIVRFEWIMLIVGSLILITGFCWDYSKFMLEQFSFKEIWNMPTQDLLEHGQVYIPRKFNWFLYCLGEGIILAGISRYWWRLRRV